MNEDVLKLLKLDLGINHTLRDEYFTKLIDSAKSEIQRRGIILNLSSVDDQILVADYAAWSYRKRTEDIPLAKNIQARIRNRIIKQRSYGSDLNG